MTLEPVVFETLLIQLLSSHEYRDPHRSALTKQWPLLGDHIGSSLENEMFVTADCIVPTTGDKEWSPLLRTKGPDRILQPMRVQQGPIHRLEVKRL